MYEVSLADEWPGFQLRAPLHRFSSPFTGAHVFYRCTHVHSSHKSAFRKQDRTLFSGSHVHTLFSHVCLIHRRTNILQVKHQVNSLTSRSSIASTNVHISFTLADHFRRFHPCSSYLRTIFTTANPVHKFTSISYTNMPFSCSNVHIPLYDEITFERVRSVRKVS